MTTASPHGLGRLGEEMARLFLAAGGYACVARGFRTRAGEIDLVVRRDDLLVFVEVKTRRGDRCGAPEEAVGPRKIARLRRLARAYLAAVPAAGVRRFRFDVVAVALDAGGGGCRLRHLAGVGAD